MSRIGELPDDLDTRHNRPLYAPKDLEDLANLILRIARQGGRARPLSGANATGFVTKGFKATDVAIQVLPNNPARRYLLVQNNSFGFMYVGFGSKPAASNGFLIRPGKYFEPDVVPASSIYVLGTTNKATATYDQAGIVIEG